MRLLAKFFCFYFLLASPLLSNITSVKIEGAKRTQKAVFLRELGLDQGQPFNEVHWQEGMQRIKNLPMVFTARGRVAGNNENPELMIDVVERWTLIPILKFQGTGSMRTLTLGAYDVNLLGRYKELGSQVELTSGDMGQMRQNWGAVVWFKDPRLGGSRYELDQELWLTSRFHNLYSEDRQVVSGYLQDSLVWHSRLRGEWSPRVRWEMRLATHADQVERASAQQLLSGNPIEYLDTALGLGIILGRLNRDGFLQHGRELKINIDQWLQAPGLPLDLTLEWTAQKRAFGKSHAAVRAGSRLSTHREIHRQPSLGDLEQLRGIRVEQFRAPAVMWINTELRFFGFDFNWVKLQHVLFYDTGQAGDHAGSLLDGRRPWVQSAGTGIRFLIPKVYRLNVRIDAAWSFGRSPGSGLSFGLQQFF